jgi:hypothetical protein
LGTQQLIPFGGLSYDSKKIMLKSSRNLRKLARMYTNVFVGLKG